MSHHSSCIMMFNDWCSAGHLLTPRLQHVHVFQIADGVSDTGPPQCCTIVLLLFLCHQPFSGFSLVIVAIVTIIIAVMLVMSTQLRAATTPTNRSSQIIYSAIHHISYYSAHDIFCCTVSHSQSIVACQLISVDVVIRMLHGYLLLIL